jgi:hypothetical protein
MLDFEITEEEMRLAQEEIEQKLSFDDIYKHKDKSRSKDVASPTRAHDDVMELVDPFHDAGGHLEEVGNRKELTNMPLHNADYDSNPYTSKGYSTRPHNSSKNQLISKTGKESMTKYCDPYSDPQNEE